MKIHVDFAQEAILSKGGLNHVKVELIPPVIQTKEQNKKPVLMMVVLDKSGSMSGNIDGTVSTSWPYITSSYGTGCHYMPKAETNSKMRQAINSTIKLVQMLSSKDLFGAVVFDDIAVQTQGLTHITPENRNEVIYHLRNVHPGGCTNISQALEMARKMITKEHIEKYNCKIIVLSDGQANAGIREADGFASLALKYLQDGITVSALGIGYDYDSSVMNAIATGGGGLFYHVEDLEQLDKFFLEELELSHQIKAKSVKMILPLPELIEVGENLNDYKQKTMDNAIEVYIGDMANSREVFFEIRNNFVDEKIDFHVEVLYQTPEGEDKCITVSKTLAVVDTEEKLQKAAKNQDMIDSILSLIKYRAFRETSDLYEKGKKEDVQHMFTSSINYVKQMSDSYQLDTDCRAVTGTLCELNSLNTTYSSAHVPKSYTKKLYAQSTRNVK